MTPSPCPRCHVALAVASVPPFTMLGCGACGGVWLEHAAVRALLTGGEPRIEELAGRAARATISRPDRRPANLPCPLCSSPMAQCDVTHAMIAVDTCNLHGTWFDADEVRRVRDGLVPPVTTRIVEVRVPVRQADDFGAWWDAEHDDRSFSLISALAKAAFHALDGEHTPPSGDGRH